MKRCVEDEMGVGSRYLRGNMFCVEKKMEVDC